MSKKRKELKKHLDNGGEELKISTEDNLDHIIIKSRQDFELRGKRDMEAAMAESL